MAGAAKLPKPEDHLGRALVAIGMFSANLARCHRADHGIGPQVRMARLHHNSRTGANIENTVFDVSVIDPGTASAATRRGVIIEMTSIRVAHCHKMPVVALRAGMAATVRRTPRADFDLDQIPVQSYASRP
jgi:hypothetical protein